MYQLTSWGEGAPWFSNLKLELLICLGLQCLKLTPLKWALERPSRACVGEPKEKENSCPVGEIILLKSSTVRCNKKDGQPRYILTKAQAGMKFLTYSTKQNLKLDNRRHQGRGPPTKLSPKLNSNKIRIVDRCFSYKIVSTKIQEGNVTKEICSLVYKRMLEECNRIFRLLYCRPQEAVNNRPL